MKIARTLGLFVLAVAGAQVLRGGGEEMRAARSRLLAGSRVVSTACGAVEVAEAGEGPPVQRAAALICEGEERHTLAAFLGLADDEHLHEKALTVALNHLDQLAAIIERLTGNEQTGITETGGGR
jgi:hypothetical protein